MANKVFITSIYEINADSNILYPVLHRHWPIVKISYGENDRDYLSRIILTCDDNKIFNKVFDWYVSYQRAFIFRLSGGNEFRFETADGKAIDQFGTNAKVGRDIMKFIDEFNSGKFDDPQLQVYDEVEFMDI